MLFYVNCFVNKNNYEHERYIVKEKDHKDLTNKGESICYKLVVVEKFTGYKSYCLNYQLSI